MPEDFADVRPYERLLRCRGIPDAREFKGMSRLFRFAVFAQHTADAVRAEADAHARAVVRITTPLAQAVAPFGKTDRVGNIIVIPVLAHRFQLIAHELFHRLVVPVFLSLIFKPDGKRGLVIFLHRRFEDKLLEPPPLHIIVAFADIRKAQRLIGDDAVKALHTAIMVYGFNLICIHGWISFQDRKMVFYSVFFRNSYSSSSCCAV